MPRGPKGEKSPADVIGNAVKVIRIAPKVARPAIYVMQFYRREPGDIGIPDLPVGERQDPEGTVTRALIGYFNNQTISPAQRPHHARVVTEDGFKTILTIMATGPTTVEKVPDA